MLVPFSEAAGTVRESSPSAVVIGHSLPRRRQVYHPAKWNTMRRFPTEDICKT
jgi:hypothetical protein